MLSGNVPWVAADFWEAQPAFFAVPCFVFKHTFWTDLLASFRQSLMRCSGLPHPKQFLFFFWYILITFTKQTIYSLDWYVSAILPDTSKSSSADSSLSLSFSFYLSPWSSSALSFPMVLAQVAKVWLPFSLHEGNKFPSIWECITFIPLVAGIFGGRRSLTSAHLSQPLCSSKKVGVAGHVLTIHCMSQHLLVFRIKTFIQVIGLHLFHVLLLHPLQVLQLEYLDLLGKMYTELSYVLIWSLLERLEFLTEGIECYYNTIVII